MAAKMDEAGNAKPGTHGCGRLGCFALLIVLVLIFLFPDTVGEVSPDGRLQVKMTATNGWLRVLGVEGTLSIDLDEKTTGRHIHISRIYVGNAYDNDFPYAVIWHPASSRFACILMSSEVGGAKARCYVFNPIAHSVQTENGRWLRTELKRRLADSNQRRREEADEILRRDYDGLPE